MMYYSTPPPRPKIRAKRPRVKELIQEGEMICRRGSLSPQALFSNICMVAKVIRSKEKTLVYIANCQGYGGVIEQDNSVDLDPQWFRLFHEGKLIAPYESDVISYVLSHPGCSVEEINACYPNAHGIQGVRAAITRIANKGFTMINCYIRN